VGQVEKQIVDGEGEDQIHQTDDHKDEKRNNEDENEEHNRVGQQNPAIQFVHLQRF
jgi:hypothetical protein